MRKLFALFILVSSFSCNGKIEPEKQSEFDEKVSILQKENGSLKLELSKYESQVMKNTNLFLTNNLSKYWKVISINGRLIKKPKVIWQFDFENNYNRFVLKNNSLTEYQTGDEIYSNTFKTLTNNEILLNGYRNRISKISNDTLKIGNNNRQYILILFEL